MLGGSDCELLQAGALLVQPVNAISSLAFVVAGLAVFPRRRWFGMLLVAVGIGSVVYHGPQPPGSELVHDITLGAVVVGAAVLAWRGRRDPRRLLAAAGLLGLGLVANALGRTGAVSCDPASLLQGHAAWHVLAAASLAVLARERQGTARTRVPQVAAHAGRARSPSECSGIDIEKQ